MQRLAVVLAVLASVIGQASSQFALAGSGGGSAGGGGCVPAPAGLVGWWKADGSTLDVTGANPGTPFGGVGYEPGVVGQAFSFDGMNDGVGLGDPVELALTGSLTVEAWVLVRSFPRSSNIWGQIVFRGDDRGGRDPYFLAATPGGGIIFAVESNARRDSVTAQVSLGVPVHVAGTLDVATGTLSLYFDGNLVASRSTAVRPIGALDPSASPGVGIGNHAPSTVFNQPFHGWIDEVAIYSRALSASEVRSIYAAGAAGKCVVAASVGVFGQGCASSGGMPTMQPAAGSLPALGRSLVLEVDGLPQSPLNAVFGVVGASSTLWEGLALPYDLESVGMPGCQLLVSGEILALVPNLGGSATWSIPVPADATLAGGDYYAQIFVLDPGNNQLGAAVSNAVAASMGY